MSVRTRTRQQPEARPLSEPVLADIVRRVVEVAKPQRIVMFGSAARGTMGADSDPGLSSPVTKREHRRALWIATGVLRWATRQVERLCP